MEETREVSGDGQEPSLEKLEALGLILSKSRSEAIRGREASGIEQEWTEDEEYFEGIDDANRGESKSFRSKPPGQISLRDPNSTSSTIFPNITRPYCEAAAARVGDILLPTDDRGWALRPTPVPTLVSISKGKFPVDIQRQIEGQIPDPAAQETTRQEIVDEITKDIESAKEKSSKAERRIDDWHVQCQYHAHNRQILEDCTRLGTGVIKGPFPKKTTVFAFINGKLEQKVDIVPASERLDPWNCFPDPQCGENIHNGSFFWERADITRKELSELKGTPGYIDEQIDSVLQEGPKKAVAEYDDNRAQLGTSESENKNLFEIWYFHGQMTKEVIEAAGGQVDEDLVFAQVTIVNNTIIRSTLNPLDTGEFPYDFMVWQRRANSPWGIGVARQIRPSQRMVVGAARNMMDNAGLSGGPMWVVDRSLVVPVNGVWELAPRKGWVTKEGANMDGKTTKDAFTFIVPPMEQERLQGIIFLGLKLAEDVTGLPLLMQGQQGKAPDTVGGMQILNNNASTVLRRIARLFDDLITEPHVRRYYNYLLQYGEDEEKGDFMVDARGSSALVERDIQNQQILQMSAIVANPIFGLDPKKWASEFLKSQRLDPKRFEYDDEKWRQLVEQLSQRPQDQSLAVAQLNNETKERIKAFELQYGQIENDKQRAFEGAMKEIDIYLDQQEQSGVRSIELDKLRARLTENREKLATQIKLSGTQALTPPVEPRGRAESGKSFQQ